jgi:hypothetical protein
MYSTPDQTMYRIYSAISRYFGSSILVQKSMSDL